MPAEHSPSKRNLKIGDLTLSLAHPKLLKSFNTWLVGGAYHPQNFGRTNDYAVMGEKRKSPQDPELLEEETRKNERLKERIVAKQEKLKADREKPKHEYVNKIGPGSSSDPLTSGLKGKKAQAGASTGGPRSPLKSASPASQTSSKRLQSSTATQKAFDQKAYDLENHRWQLESRERLKHSLIDHSNSSSYQTLFPPLFTPYDRTPNTIRTWVDAKATVDASARSPRKPDPPIRAPLAETNSLTVVKNGPSGKPRGRIAGHQAFMPTGSTSTPYRCYTNYRMAVESTEYTANEDRHSQPSMVIPMAITADAHDLLQVDTRNGVEGQSPRSPVTVKLPTPSRNGVRRGLAMRAPSTAPAAPAGSEAVV